MWGILYESDQWMNTKPIGEQEWDVHHVPSTAEGSTARFLEEEEEEGEVGDRATYVRLRMLTMISPLEESYQTVRDELTRQGPSFMKGERHANGKFPEKSQSGETYKSA